MKPPIFLIGTLLLLVAGVATAQSPPAKEPAVAQIIVLDVGPNPSAAIPKLIDMMKRGNALAQKTGNHGKARLWVNTFAGPQAGTLIVVIETPSLGLLAADGAKMRMDPEWAKLFADVEATGFKVLSESLATEVPF
jgi:hypothetical protein